MFVGTAIWGPKRSSRRSFSAAHVARTRTGERQHGADWDSFGKRIGTVRHVPSRKRPDHCAQSLTSCRRFGNQCSVPFQPIIPTRREYPFELKLDGFRCIADTIALRWISKQRNRMKRFDRLLGTLPYGYVFDGKSFASMRPAGRASGAMALAASPMAVRPSTPRRVGKIASPVCRKRRFPPAILPALQARATCRS